MFGLIKYLRVAFGASLGGGALPVLALAVLTAVYGFAYSKGSHRANERCQTAALETTVATQQATITSIQNRLSRANEARALARVEAEQDAKELDQERKQVDAFKKEIAARPSSCPVSADDAERLRRIGQ